MIRRLLFGRRCIFCREPLGLKISEQEYLCEDCSQALEEKYCCKSGKAVVGAAQTQAVFWYRDEVRRAMVGVKFQHRTAALNWFAEQTADRLAAVRERWCPDVVVFVPTTWMRKWVRGYNQSEALARRAAARCGLPCVNVLRRRWFKPRQSRMQNRSERRHNAARLFAAKPNVRLDGKRVVLIDDIFTTGASAEACVGLLRELGASEVFLLTATRVP